MYSIQFTSSSAKEIEALPAFEVTKIFSKIESLNENPKPHGTKKLKGKASLWRIRFGNYRVVYSILEKKLIIEIIRIAPRKEAYKNL